MNDSDVDDRPPSAAEAQDLIREQRARASRSISPDPRTLYWPWSIAWLVGFGCLYLRFGPDDQVLVPMPEWLPLTVLYVMMAAALVISGVSGARHARHIKGDSQVKGATYGFAWFLGFAGIGVSAGRVSDLLPPAETGLLWAGLSVAFVAAMYLAGGALWGERDMVILGVWVGVVNVVGVLVGPGWHSLIIATAGAAGGLVAGYVAARRLNRGS